MIKLKLDKKQNAYDVVGEYIKKYWDKLYYTDVIVHIATSYDDKSYTSSNEFVAFDGNNDMIYESDWWEGEPYLIIYGIIDIHKVYVPDNIFLKNYKENI